MKRIVVVSYSKSGATWFRFLVYGAEKGIPSNSVQVNKFYPFDRTRDYIWPKDRDRVFVKTHSYYRPEVPIIKENDGSILIIRNPFDLIFSWLAHMRLSGLLLYSHGDLIQYFKMFENKSKNMDYHYNSWKDKVSIIIKYEDMIQDLDSGLNKVNKALDLDWSSTDIKNAVISGNKEKMAQMEEYEMANKIEGGLFYKPKKVEAYTNRKERFIGGRRKKEDLDVFLNDFKDDFLKFFTPLADELGYDLNKIIKNSLDHAKRNC